MKAQKTSMKAQTFFSTNAQSVKSMKPQLIVIKAQHRQVS